MNRDDRLLVALVAVLLIVGLVVGGYSIIVSTPPRGVAPVGSADCQNAQIEQRLNQQNGVDAGASPILCDGRALPVGPGGSASVGSPLP